MKNIYFDESGNTGPDLLNEDQPHFVLVSTDLEENESENILKQYFDISKEIHFKNEKKSKAGKQRILDFLKNSHDIIRDHCAITYTDKKFGVCCLLVYYYIEPILYDIGYDLFDLGQNIIFANSIYYFLPEYCTKKADKEIYTSFLDFVKTPSEDSKSNFKDALENAYNLCTNEDFKHTVIQLLLASFQQIDESFKYVNKDDLNFALPSLIDSIQFWMNKYPEGLELNHDESTIVEKLCPKIDFLTKINKPHQDVGYGAFKYKYPLNLDKINMKNSKNSFSVQFCDIIASSITHGVKNKQTTNFSKEIGRYLKDINCFNVIKPNLIDLYPIISRKRMPGEINPIDYLAEQFFINNVDF